MKKSLKRRVGISFLVIIAITLAAIGIVHALFIEKLYLEGRKKILIDSFQQLNSSDSTEDLEEFMKYCSMNSLAFVITDENLNSKASNTKDSDDIIRLVFGNVLEMDSEESCILEEKDDYQILRKSDKSEGIEFLSIWGKLDNGYYYAARYPMSNIQEAAKLSLTFYVIIGVIMLLVSSIIIRQITKRLTKPIIELTELSGRMAKLDFEAKYSSGGEDEIGQLGENFNIMSQSLEKAVSELKSANARLEKDIEEKEQIDEMRREFISNASHELKTPIALISGYAEGLKEMLLDNESREYYCDVIIDEANRMNRLVRQLLSLNQLECGRDQLEVTRFNLSELINGVVNASAIVIEQKNAEIINDIPESVFVWADEFKIEQVLTNYLSNALNHLEGDKKIHINCEEKDGIVTTTIFNTGKPIPEDELDKIWTKFYKVDKARTREYGGSGIGLSIVKAIMDLHRQKCWAENYENGVAFKFTLSEK